MEAPRNSDLIPDDVTLVGTVYDVENGEVREVLHDYISSLAPYRVTDASTRVKKHQIKPEREAV